MYSHFSACVTKMCCSVLSGGWVWADWLWWVRWWDWRHFCRRGVGIWRVCLPCSLQSHLQLPGCIFKEIIIKPSLSHLSHTHLVWRVQQFVQPQAAHELPYATSSIVAMMRRPDQVTVVSTSICDPNVKNMLLPVGQPVRWAVHHEGGGASGGGGWRHGRLVEGKHRWRSQFLSGKRSMWMIEYTVYVLHNLILVCVFRCVTHVARWGTSLSATCSSCVYLQRTPAS